jgi:endonuclease/exonuclease/phosphatase family metal-dependent hydrolase
MYIKKPILLTGFCLILLMIVTSSAEAQSQKSAKPPIKVGSYNVCSSHARKHGIKDGKFKTPQKYWCNSADAVAQMIHELDCDVIGLQEIGDTTWGLYGDHDLRNLVAAKRSKKDQYIWVLYENHPKRIIHYDNAIGFRKSRFKLLDDGIFYLGGVPDKPQVIPGIAKGAARPVVWVKLQDKVSKQDFYFFSIHLILERSVDNDGRNLYNAQQFVKIASELMPEGSRAIAVGDFNAHFNNVSYNCISEAGWSNVCQGLKKQGKLASHVLSAGSQPTKDETGWGKWFPDHIFTKGFEHVSFDIDRRMLSTADGTLHYPSDHFPIFAEIIFE